MDCEGFERELLDPAQVPELAATVILVELHDFVDPTISRLWMFMTPRAAPST